MSTDYQELDQSKQQRIPTVRLTPSNEIVLQQLGPLSDLAGTWHGHGFNLIARPDKEGNAPLYLELNLTDESLRLEPISTSIPNRGFLQDDIELFGLTYIQKISDSLTGSALHIEPGIWVNIPDTSKPEESRSIARMGSIPHGNALLAEGTATKVHHPDPAKLLALSTFPSFNTTPFGLTTFGPPFTPLPPIIQARGSLSAFPAYTYLNPGPPPTIIPATAANPRTPVPALAPTLPISLDHISMQQIIQDPDSLLQAHLNKQLHSGHELVEATVLNIATQAEVEFQTVVAVPAPPPAPPGPPPGSPTVKIAVKEGGGGVENIPFLKPNAKTALVYATFWIEKIKLKHSPLPPFLQLQYAQMVLLNFPILNVPAPPGAPGPPVLSWPHVSVGTLKKVFG
jgi:hypothetical protein